MAPERDDHTPIDWVEGPDSLPTRAFDKVSPAMLHSRPPRLNQVEGPGAPREVNLGDGPLVLGRGEGCDVQIVSSHVSRRHVVVQPSLDDLECRDLESRNGTWLNNLRVHSATLREGDVVQIGDAVFVFRAGR